MYICAYINICPIYMLLELLLYEIRWRVRYYLMEHSFSSLSSEDEEPVLRPVSHLPPNEIITKKYTPDIKPVIKLIQTDKKQKRRITLTNEAKHQYSDMFNDNDSLGYQYSTQIKHNLVYFKLNNKNYMKLQDKNQVTRYFAGMFIPLESLIGQEIKKKKNIYKILPNIEYVEYKHSIQNSFGVNCFSEAPNVKFTSNYESSNLFAAFKVSENQYDLILQNDINSKGNTQWFNFAVELPQQKGYKFNIVNLTKTASLYQKGMSIVYLSQQQRFQNRGGWTRGCHNISYEATSVNREDSDDSFYYKLHFQYQNHFKNDVVTFAYCYPYHTLDLQKFFNKVVFKRGLHQLKIQKIKICQTLSGFSLYAYSISNKKIALTNKKFASNKFLDQTQNPSNNENSNRNNIIPSKSLVFIGRQHPGESQGSFVVEGLVQFLMENNDYESYKKPFTFYIIPMVNIDGVFYGNYRTNLSGNDLNRIWRNPRKDYHSEIYYIKKFLVAINKANPISLIVDIHGHSSALNSFFYGNPVKKDTQFSSFENTKLFPFFCSKRVKQVSFNQSTFTVSEDKKSCARVVLSEMFPKALVYTFQNSFYGWRKGKHIVEHTIDSFKKLGRDLILSYLQFSKLFEKNPGIKEKWMKEIQEFQKESNKSEEEVLTESDDEVEKEIDLFDDVYEEKEKKSEDHFQTKEEFYSSKSQSKNHPSLSMVNRNRILKYLKKPHSPSYKTQFGMETNHSQGQKSNQFTNNQPQGFLSIIKINAKPFFKENTCIEVDQRVEIKNSRKHLQIFDNDFWENKDEIKENLTDQSIKGGKLISEKELILERLRKKKTRLEESIQASKSYNGFIKSPHFWHEKK